ncbi:MAG: hypothetical protein ABIA63_09630 [bacterium]
MKDFYIICALIPAFICWAGACYPIGAEDTLFSPVHCKGIPQRPEKACTGSEFLALTAHFSNEKRQKRAVYEFLRGNIPDFLRSLKPLSLNHPKPDGTKGKAVIWVMPDYLSIGTDKDFVRMPLTFISAVRVANAYDCVLPTRKIVDTIFARAAVKLVPVPLIPGPDMRSCAYYSRHNQIIEKQRGDRYECEIIAGHKKDLVLTNRLQRMRKRVAIYGWHRKEDDPIQPLSTAHTDDYADYSHGVRLISSRVWLDGNFYSIYDILKQKSLAPALTYEGCLSNTRALMKHGVP